MQNIKKTLQLISQQMKKDHPLLSKKMKEAISLINTLNKENLLLKKEISKLKKEISKLKKENKQIQCENTKLQKNIKDLKDKNNINSHNSSKPPSTDGFKKQKKNSKEKTGQKKGGQKGHPGCTLKKDNNPDEIVEIAPKFCKCCKRDLSDIEGETTTKQVKDVYIIRKVIEFRNTKKICKCGYINTESSPTGVDKPVQYGNNLKSLIAYLSNYHLIPYKRIQEFCSDVLNYNISLGTIFNINKELYNKLEPWSKKTIEDLILSFFNNFKIHSNKTFQIFYIIPNIA